MTLNQWIPNPGTGNPVREGETLAAIRFRDGSENDDCGHGSNWAWGKAGSLSITHYQVSPPRVAEPATMSATEAEIAAIHGVNRLLWMPMLLHAMAGRYCQQAQLCPSEGMDAAVATWGTEWEDDPAPRTMQMALDAVDSDLQHWRD